MDLVVWVSRRSRALAVVGRATVLGAAGGVVLGGVVQTVSFPIVGTFFGAIVGGVFGAASGVVCGAALATISALTSSAVGERLASGVTGLLCGVAIASFAAAPWRVTGHVKELSFVATCGALAAVLGPLAVHEVRTVNLGRWLGERTAPVILQGALAAGIVCGCALGAVAGLIVGALTYLPTCPVAMIEGGVLGSGSGVVIAFSLVGVLVVPRMRVATSLVGD